MVITDGKVTAYSWDNNILFSIFVSCCWCWSCILHSVFLGPVCSRNDDTCLELSPQQRALSIKTFGATGIVCELCASRAGRTGHLAAFIKFWGRKNLWFGFNAVSDFNAVFCVRRGWQLRLPGTFAQFTPRRARTQCGTSRALRQAIFLVEPISLNLIDMKTIQPTTLLLKSSMFIA